MIPLPVDSHLPAALGALRSHRALVLVAEPGAGKTTRVPPAIVRSGLLGASHPNLVMLQPRRVAARAAAERIAEEQNWRVGDEVGYQVRFENRITARTRLRVITEGILTRQLLSDPELAGIGCVMLDEFHERSIHTDLALAMLREVRESLREDLLLVVMSATLDAEPIARFLDGAPILRVPGRMFPINITHAPPMGAPIVEHAVRTVRDTLNAPPPSTDARDDVLVFLPGAGEIERCCDALADLPDIDVLPLHGTLPFEQQARALRPGPRRRVIVATNIAETSLTIDGVTTVIDAGLARVPLFDPQRGLDRLELIRISDASARQRAGRAGRTAPGRCIRLWTSQEHAQLEPFDAPEIRRVDLCPTVLTLHAWGAADVRSFRFFERPDDDALLAADDLLHLLGALESGRLTDLGKRLHELPLHPRLGRLLLEAARLGALQDGSAIAAILSERDLCAPRRTERDSISQSHATGDSDVQQRLDLLKQAEAWRFAARCRDVGVDPQAARQAARTRDDLFRQAERLTRSARSPRDDAVDHALATLPLLAYPDRVCRRRESATDRAIMTGGGGVRLAAESVVKRAELFVACDARHDARSRASEAMVRIAVAIDESDLQHHFPQAMSTETLTRYDPAADRVIAVKQTRYRDLVLRESPTGEIDRDRAAEVLYEALRSEARLLLESDEAAMSLVRRIELLGAHLIEHAWPSVTDDLDALLREACGGCRSRREIRLVDAIRARLVYPLDRLLDEHAPETIRVPTGNRIRVDYTTGRPVLAVRLQEMFGQRDTPRIAAGRVKVVLHLLGPNYRPVQVTDDLASFWINTYPQVRKDLRARYPRHAWPDNPETAPPIAKGRPTK
ncbi:MAG TPA: ATP-dependent helicase HrpB [Tepidisphaeraceae bacterium]|nr:ATP-dependent helicase HrpB [Tepidisphaeraceae bacterium]